MSQKSQQKSRSKPQMEDYASSSPQPQLFEHYAQFRDDEPAIGSVLGHPSASERKRLDEELELVKQEKEKLALELEVLHLRKFSHQQLPQLHRHIGECISTSSSRHRQTAWVHYQQRLRLLCLQERSKTYVPAIPNWPKDYKYLGFMWDMVFCILILDAHSVCVHQR